METTIAEMVYHAPVARELPSLFSVRDFCPIRRRDYQGEYARAPPVNLCQLNQTGSELKSFLLIDHT